MFTLIGAVLCLWAVGAFAYCVIGTTADRDWLGFLNLMIIGFVVVSLMAGNLWPFAIYFWVTGASILITMAVNVYKMTR